MLALHYCNAHYSTSFSGDVKREMQRTDKKTERLRQGPALARPKRKAEKLKTES
jgi:hypothetical protein